MVLFLIIIGAPSHNPSHGNWHHSPLISRALIILLTYIVIGVLLLPAECSSKLKIFISRNLLKCCEICTLRGIFGYVVAILIKILVISSKLPCRMIDMSSTILPQQWIVELCRMMPDSSSISDLSRSISKASLEACPPIGQPLVERCNPKIVKIVRYMLS